MNCKKCNNEIFCWSSEKNEVPQIDWYEFYKLCKDCYYRKAIDNLLNRINRYMENKKL